MQLTITGCTAAADGGTVGLSATDKVGAKHRIQLNQHAFPRRDEAPGRLIFDGELVPLRSEMEVRVLSLLRAAITADDLVQSIVNTVVEFVESEAYLRFAERVEQAKDTNRYDVHVVWDAATLKQSVVRLNQILRVGYLAARKLLEEHEPVARGVSALEASDVAARYRAVGLEVTVRMADQQG